MLGEVNENGCVSILFQRPGDSSSSVHAGGDQDVVRPIFVSVLV